MTRSPSVSLHPIELDNEVLSPAMGWDRDAGRRALDELFSLARQYRSTKAYRALLDFIGRFPFYSPFNAMLIHVQMPGATGPSRAPEAPDIPTMQESGFPGFDVRAWYGVLAPAATPQNIVLRFHRNLTQILTMPEVRAALKREGLDIYMTTPQEFAEYIRTQKLFWAKVIKDARIKAA